MSMIFNDLKECSYGLSVEGTMPIWKKDDEELKAYRAIGTVSELRELKEKATAKKPLLYPFPKCPSCNHVLPYALVKYCSNCGTALDLSEGKE